MSLTVHEINREEVHRLAASFEKMPVSDILRWAWDRFGERAAIGTSFQGAGLVMIHHAVKAGLQISGLHPRYPVPLSGDTTS